MCVKFGLPSRLSWVSRYEKFRPCSSGSLVKSIPGTTFWVQKATCSVSAKKLSTQAVEDQPADAADRQHLLGDDLGGVEHVEVELLGEVLVEELQARAPTRGSRRRSMASQRSRRWKSGSAPLIFTASFQTTDCSPCFGFQWNLTKVDLPSALTSRKVWTPKPSMNRNDRGMRPVGHDPHDHVHALGRERDEVPEVVVGGLRLREVAVRLGLDGVDQVGELDRVLDEEDRDVVADEVPVALLGVELDGEAADVAGEVGRALAAGDGREADEDRGLLALALEEVGPGDVGERLVVLEVAVGAVAAGVDDPLGDALVVEVEDLLAEVEVFQERRAARADPERVLVVGDGDALLGGQDRSSPSAT